MTVAQLFEVAWRERRRRGLQTSLLIAVYAAAVAVAASLVVLLGSARQASDKIMRNTGTHFITFARASTQACLTALASQAGEGLICGSVPALPLPTNWVDQIKSLPAVLDASAYLMYRFRDERSGNDIAVGGFDVTNQQAVGTTCCADGDIISGRFLKPEDRGCVLLDEGFARARGLSAGKQIAIAGTDFEVTGIVNPGIRPGKADVYMPFAEAAAFVCHRAGAEGLNGRPSAVLVEVRSSQRQEDAFRSIKAIFPCMVISSYACYKPAAEVMGITAGVVGGVVAGIYLAVVLFAMLIQTASVIERRHDLALLSALGWTSGEIAGTVLMESVICAVGGIVVGTFFAPLFLLCAAPAVTWEAGPWALLQAFPLAGALAAGMTLVSGVLACCGPVVSVLRARPAEVFRNG